MSKFQKSKSKDSQKSESSKDNQTKNQGPAGFSLFEYQGPGKDHANAWLKFKRDLKSVIVQNKLDDMLEKIIDEGIDPQVEELDLNELMKSAPSKFNKVKVATLDQDDFVSDLNDSEQESKTSKSSISSKLKVAKPKSDATDDEKINPHYDLQMTLFNEDLKTASKARMNRVLQLEKDKKFSIQFSGCSVDFLCRTIFEASRHSRRSILKRTHCGCSRR